MRCHLPTNRSRLLLPWARYALELTLGLQAAEAEVSSISGVQYSYKWAFEIKERLFATEMGQQKDRTNGAPVGSISVVGPAGFEPATNRL